MPESATLVRLPPDWAGPIIYSWGQTGLFGRMARDAIFTAVKEKRFGDADVYRAMLDQFGDFCADHRP